MVGQVLQEISWLNEACTYEVLELKEQLLEIGKQVEEKRKKLVRNAEYAGEYGGRNQEVESDPELQTLTREQRSINHRSTLCRCPIIKV